MTTGLVLACFAGELFLRTFYFQQTCDNRFALSHYYSRISQRLGIVWRTRVGIWRWDDELGYDHKPGTSGVHRSDTGDFRVTYTIDDSGCRVTPAPRAPVGEILFLGDSVSFGFGVEDHEAFPFVLGSRYWPEVKIRNRSVQGWGTSHALIALRKQLDTGHIPDLIVYAMIPHHIQRNYLRASWLNEITKWCPAGERRGHPNFDFIDGKLRFLGVVGAEAGKPESLQLRNKEVALTAALLTEISELARQHSVPFTVVLLPSPIRDYPPLIIQALTANRTPCVDLTDMEYASFVHDPHPTPDTHAAIARRIAGSILNDFAVGMRTNGGHDLSSE